MTGVVALATGIGCRRVVPNLRSVWRLGLPGCVVLVRTPSTRARDLTRRPRASQSS